MVGIAADERRPASTDEDPVVLLVGASGELIQDGLRLGGFLVCIVIAHELELALRKRRLLFDGQLQIVEL